MTKPRALNVFIDGLAEFVVDKGLINDKELICRKRIESFRFQDQYDYEYVISSMLLSSCARVNQRHFGGKKMIVFVILLRVLARMSC